MKTAEIKELTLKELEERIENEQSLLRKLELNHAVSPLDNPMKIRFTRKNVARLMTELSKRQLANQKKS
jgi:large subunit ribosomal protein L29